MFGRRIAAVALVLAASVALVACGSSSSSASKPKASTTTSAPKVTGAITVSAAASLTEAFGTIGQDFSAANPGATVRFNFGSSGTLATQIQQGAPADGAQRLGPYVGQRPQPGPGAGCEHDSDQSAHGGHALMPGNRAIGGHVAWACLP